jgi:hypothetical protein
LLQERARLLYIYVTEEDVLFSIFKYNFIYDKTNDKKPLFQLLLLAKRPSHKNKSLMFP